MRWLHRHSRDFEIHVVQMKKGDSFSNWVPQLQPNETPPPDRQWVKARSITFVSRGALDITRSDGKTIRFNTGDGCYDVYQTGPIRMQAAEGDSEWLCIIPRKLETWWSREQQFYKQGGMITLPANDKPWCIYVAVGSANGHATHSMLNAAAGKEIHLSVEAGTWLLFLHPSGAADLSEQQAAS